jgi:DNA-binding NarL/FixJ family response regulator
MPAPPISVLLVTDNPALTGQLTDALSQSASETSLRLSKVAGCEEARAGPVAGADVAVIDALTSGQDLAAIITEVRSQQPERPVIVLTSEDDALTDIALAAGAHHCLRSADAFQPLILQTIRTSLFARTVPAEFAGGLSAEGEMGTLQDIYGPSPLPVSQQSFGMRTLAEKLPDEFRRLTRDYLRIIEIQLEQQAFKGVPANEDDVDRLAERLGILNAGPRDVIEMHKVAVATKLIDQPPVRAKAYLAESRLSLLRLMGYLVSFYRTRSWGRPFERRQLSAERANDAHLPSKPPDDS